MIFLQIGTRVVKMQVFRNIKGTAYRASATVAGSSGGSEVSCEIVAVHTCDCPSTRMGRNYKPCNCGADDLFRQTIEASGEVYHDPGCAHPKYVAYLAKKAAAAGGEGS